MLRFTYRKERDGYRARIECIDETQDNMRLWSENNGPAFVFARDAWDHAQWAANYCADTYKPRPLVTAGRPRPIGGTAMMTQADCVRVNAHWHSIIDPPAKESAP